MNDMTEMLDSLILQVTTLKGPSAVVVFIIMLGYALKMVPKFPNKYIPLASFVIGPVLTLILVGPPGTGTLSPNLFWPDLAAHVSCLVTGFLLSCVAWIMHAKFLRKMIDDKVPELNPKPEKPNEVSVPAAPAAPAGLHPVPGEADRLQP
jgi:hypothetical protein